MLFSKQFKNKAVEIMFNFKPDWVYWFDLDIELRKVDHAPSILFVYKPFLFEFQFSFYDVRHVEDK